jgi:CheY-like chemotaxis protein/PAS domain-containing protein
MPHQALQSRFFALSPNAYMVLDPQLSIVDANQAYLRVTDRQLEDLRGRNVFEAFPGPPGRPADPGTVQLRDSLEKVLRSRETDHIALIRYDIAERHPDGTDRMGHRYWSASHMPILDEAGDVSFILQHTVDVTELQMLKHAARARHAPPDGTADARSPEPASSLNPEISEAGVLERAQALQQANRTLIGQYRRLLHMFDQSPGFFAMLRGPLHTFEMVNQAYYQLVGRRELVGRTVREALPEVVDQSYIQLLDRVYATGEPFVGRGMRLQLRRQLDEPLADARIDFLYQPIFEADGSVSGIFVQGSDVTEQHRALEETRTYRDQLEELVRERTAALLRSQAEHAETQAQLQHVQKLESLGRLTGGVAHDFNNLLQVVGSSLHLLKVLTGQQVPKAQRWIETATNAVASGAKLTGQLLAFARRQPLAPQTINVGQIVDGMGDLLGRALGETIEIRTMLAPDLWNTYADPHQLENVILNLAINARDAMSGSGRLFIESYNTTLDSHHGHIDPDLELGDYVLLSVSDSGCGMTPEVLEKAFEPFFSTKLEGHGTGLGLSMVYGYVKQSGGHVKIYSEVGRGTTVKIFLRRALRQEDSAPVVDAGPVRGGTETILVAEDDPQVLAAAIETLCELGYRVVKATDGPSALAVVQGGAHVDLLFTDVVMPGGMRGPDLARHVRSLRPEMPVLYTSGYTENAFPAGGPAEPHTALLPKPYRQEDLARRLRQLLEGARPAPAQAAAHAGEAADPVVLIGAPETAQASLRILFVEDNEPLQAAVSELLEAMSHQVTTVSSGEQALERADDVAAFDLLLTDIRLPGMSGHDLARQLRDRHPALRIIFASGYGRATVPAATVGVEGALMLHKPYTRDVLAQAIARALQRP